MEQEFSGGGRRGGGGAGIAGRGHAGAGWGGAGSGSTPRAVTAAKALFSVRMTLDPGVNVACLRQRCAHEYIEER